MTEDRELHETRTLLRDFDLGPLGPLDLDDVMRRGDRARRIAVADRLLAVAGLVVLLAAVGFGLNQLTTQPAPPIAPTPTVTATTPAPSPSQVPAVVPTPVVAFTAQANLAGEGPVGVGFAVNGNGNSIWAISGSSAGRPGHLWAADPERPDLRQLADVGTYPTSLAVVPGREWVVNDAAAPNDNAYKAGTVDEFDASGRLVHEYQLPKNPGFVYVTARGTDAWTLMPRNATVVVTHLANGRQDVIATLTEPNKADVITVGIALRGDGRLAVLTYSTNPTGLQLWTVDPTSGAATGPTALPLGAWAEGSSLAVQGDRVLVAGRNDGSTAPALVAVDAAGVHPLTGCGALTVSVAADATGAWLTTAAGDTSQGLVVAPVGESGCGAGLRLPGSGAVPATGAWARNVLVLSGNTLSGVVLTPLWRPPSTTLIPADSTAPAAGICGTDPGTTVTIDANPDTPAPRCAIVTAGQNLRVVNNQAMSITVRFADYAPRDVRPGASTVFQRAFGSFLAPGVHDVSWGVGGPGELWLK